MFRRPRFSVRPKVGTPGKPPQEAASATPEAGETPKDDGESSAAAAVTDNQSVVTSPEKPTALGDANEQNAEGTSSSAALQRRKRFSIKPKVAPGRPSTAARMQKTPVKAVSETPVEDPVSDLDKPTTSSQTGAAAAPPRLQSPRRRGSSEDGKQQPKATLDPSDGPEPSGDSAANLPADGGKELESGKKLESERKGVKGAPSRLPDIVPFCIPDREAMELSEKARTLVSSKSRLSISPPAFSLSRLLNDPSDLQRIAKAQKLRDLLRQEMHKEKKLKKRHTRVQELTLDPSKMTMRDLIRYLPQSNPMTSSLEESAAENETVIPPSPAREAAPEKAWEPAVLPKIGSPREEEEEVGEREEEDEEEEEDNSLVPQVKVAEDGTLIIDEESLTVEVLRAKGPNPAQGRDPIFERGSTTTYSSFRKGTYTKPWSSEETDMFFLAISMVGTDFSMICQLFPLRTRSEIKNKFKKEERENSWRVDKAFRERRKLDIEYFTKLLEKILEVHKNRKKLKSLAAKNSPKKTTRKPKGKKAPRKMSAVEEEDEKEENEIVDLMKEGGKEDEEGGKENEELRHEGGGDVAKPKKKRKRKNREDASSEAPDDKKSKGGEKSNEQDEAGVHTEAALPEDCPTSDMSEKTESVSEATGDKIKPAKIKPAKLSRGRAPRPPVSKPPPASTKTCATASDDEDQSAADGEAEDQVDKDASSPLSPADGKKPPTEDSEEEDTAVRPHRPTRSGRVPKPIQLLNYPAKEAASGATRPASPEVSTASAARPKAKRGRPSKPQSSQDSKKPKLVTLRASQSEYSDEEDEKQREEDEEEERRASGSSEDGTAPVFVPASLRSPRPVVPEVEETMEELDILAHIPDVLGITQNESGTAEPCEHQLDLLVDVIDFLSADPTEVSENESYNEAAQTLLTIGNMAHLSPSAIPEHTTGTTSANVKETKHLEEEVAAKPAVLEETSAVPSDHGAKETSETVPVVEPPRSTTDNDDISVIESIDQRTGFEMAPPLQSPESSKTNSARTRIGRSSKVKPKPNLGQASRTAQSKLPPGTSTVRRAGESPSVAPDLAQTTETLSAAEESPTVADCSKNTLKDDISGQVRRADEPSGSQKRSAAEVQSNAATSDGSASENQSHCLSEAQSEPGVEPDIGDSRSTSGPTEEAPTAERSCNNQVTSDPAVAEPQGSNTHSAPAQESDGHLAPRVAPAEELPVDQKGEREAESTQPIRKSRFLKIKPKLNLAQAPRTLREPKTSKDTVEKDSEPTPPNPQIHGSPEPTCTKSPKKTSRCPDPASDLIPPVNLGGTLQPTEELPTTEKNKSDAATSHQRVSGQPNIPEAQFPPRREQATTDTMLTLESVDRTSHSGAAESSCNDPQLTSDSVVTESLGRGSNRESGAHVATHAEGPPVSPEEEKDAASTFQFPRRRLQKVKPKPNLAQTSRTARSKPPTSEDSAAPTCSATPPEETSRMESRGDASVSEPYGELRSTRETTEETTSREEQKTDVGSEQNVPQRRPRFAGVKPNLGSSPRTARAKPQANDVRKPPERSHVDTSLSSEPQPEDDNAAQTEQDAARTDLTSTLGGPRTEPFSPMKRVSTVSRAAPAEGSSPCSLIIAEYWGAESWSQYSDLGLENISGKEVEEGACLGDKTANNDLEEAGPASQGDRNPGMSVGATESNTRPADDPIAASEVQSSESILPTSTRSTAGSKESTRQPPAEAEGEAPSPDAVQCSDTDQTAAQSSDGNPSEPTDPPSRAAPQARRGRLVKPKPRLVRSGRPPQPRQVQNAQQAEPDVGAGSQGVDAERRPDIPDPTEGAVKQSGDQNASPDDAGSSPGCLTQAPDSSPLDASTSTEGGTQSLFMLTQQEPSDPDEPFFILSLTEIPVGSLGEPVDRAPDPLPGLPVADASTEQHSVPGGAPLPRVPVPASAEQSGETDACTTQPGWIQENPVERPESSTVHPSTAPEPPESKDETETPPEHPGGPPGTRRRAKEPAKPKTAKRKQAGRTSTPIQANPAELPGPSLQPEASVDVVTKPHRGRGGGVDVEQETEAGGGVAGDGSSAAHASRKRATKRQDRKPRGVPSVTSETSGVAVEAPAGKAASEGPKVKAPRGAGRRAAAASTSHSGAFTAPTTHTPNTSEDPASQNSDSVEPEPTSVSQYFLSDIFTDVM